VPRVAEQQYVLFWLAEQLYGAPIAVVREVNHLTPVTRLPNTPDWVDGVIDLRGEVLPVVNLRARLGLPRVANTPESRLLILDLHERSSALVVDGVDQVLTLETDALVAPDPTIVLPGQEYVTGVARANERLVVILDLVSLMA
jgi:purine-binding chemotaxis protein CheW